MRRGQDSSSQRVRAKGGFDVDTEYNLFDDGGRGRVVLQDSVVCQSPSGFFEGFSEFSGFFGC